jgi:hypothetical protein
MCYALDYANNINNQITEAKEYYNKLKIKERVFNDVQQDLLHKIEGLDKFSLYTGGNSVWHYQNSGKLEERLRMS